MQSLNSFDAEWLLLVGDDPQPRCPVLAVTAVVAAGSGPTSGTCSTVQRSEARDAHQPGPALGEAEGARGWVGPILRIVENDKAPNT
jgi:hypothetical protein